MCSLAGAGIRFGLMLNYLNFYCLYYSMSVEKHTKRMYDKYGAEYQKSRDLNVPERSFNEYLELPNMVKAVGNIKAKKLLDIGCGAGIHLREYAKKGARVYGMDISKTMLDLAANNCPEAELKLGSLFKLPFSKSFFDVVTASLCVDYVDDLDKVFRQVHKVLKKNGLFFYSNESPVNMARERYEDDSVLIKGLGVFKDKKSGKSVFLGNAWKEKLCEWDMIPGMKMKTYRKTFQTQLHALVNAGFELLDFIDCRPVPAFKKYNPEGYKLFSKMPIFSIYVARKK